MPHGVYRRVVLVGRVALKFPRLRNVPAGMNCNRWEREMWRVWRLKFDWTNLCPILFADPFGLVVVMSRAAQPVTRKEVKAADHDYYPAIACEYKPEDWGRIDGRVVVLDYAYAADDPSWIVTQRAYYASKSGPL